MKGGRISLNQDKPGFITITEESLTVIPRMPHTELPFIEVVSDGSKLTVVPDFRNRYGPKKVRSRLEVLQ